MIKYFLASIVILTIISVIFFHRNQDKKQFSDIKIDDYQFKVEIANTENKRIKGLSDRENLPEDGGMLFVFDHEGFYGIWMKDMKFSIDIAWLDRNKKIVHIESNVGPETFPKVFYPKQDGVQKKSLYVIETNAGFFEKSGIKIGDKAEF